MTDPQMWHIEWLGLGGDISLPIIHACLILGVGQSFYWIYMRIFSTCSTQWPIRFHPFQTQKYKYDNCHVSYNSKYHYICYNFKQPNTIQNDEYHGWQWIFSKRLKCKLQPFCGWAIMACFQEPEVIFGKEMEPPQVTSKAYISWIRDRTAL